MHAVTGRRLLSFLAIVPLLIVACGTSTPSTVSTSSSELTPSAEPASAPATNSPIATPSAGPDATCRPIDSTFGTPSADFDVGTPIGYSYLGLDVTHVVSNTEPDEAMDFDGGERYLDQPIRLVGGWQISLQPTIDYDTAEDVPISLLDASAVLTVDGRAPVSLDGTVGIGPRSDGTAFLFQLPDVKGRAVIDFTVRWSDRCFTYTATGGWAFELVRAAFAARCPTDHEGFAAHWAALAEPPFQVRDVPVDLIRIETVGLWTPYAVASQGNTGLSTWDISSVAAAAVGGGTLRSGESNPDLRLLSLRAEFYRRKAVVDWLAGGDLPRSVFSSTAAPYPDGHFELLVPNNAGRYVARLSVEWESPCAYGGAIGAVAIDVQ